MVLPSVGAVAGSPLRSVAGSSVDSSAQSIGSTLYVSCVLIVELILVGAFMVTDLVSFYVLFEAVLIPIWLLIVQYGSSSMRVRASMLFFMYTLTGSLSMLLAVGYMYVSTGTGDYTLLTSSAIDYDSQLWL